MNIRKSTEQDFERMMEIYSYARDQMIKTGNPNQWGPTNWPPEALIHHDIEMGNSYVCENDVGKVIGTFYFICGKDIEPTYRKITDGEWMDESPYGVVHRIAADGSEKGIGAFCINWAITQCGHLRIDTHGDNKVMQHLLTKLGFRHCGTIYVEEDDYPRLAFEYLNIRLLPLERDDREQFIRDNQEAFNYGALEEFGRRDDHLEEDGQIISRETIEKSIESGIAYRIMEGDKKVGGAVIKIEGTRGDLDLLFTSPKVHSKGIGYAAWCEIERLHPEVEVWETVTPYFETRNIHFYVNRCGFHIVEYYNKYHKAPNEHKESGEDIQDSMDGMFRFEKRMK